MLEMVDDILLQEFGSYAPQLESMEKCTLAYRVGELLIRISTRMEGMIGRYISGKRMWP